MIIVNFATGHYIKGQNRLRESLKGTDVMFLGFTDHKEIGSPAHKESPYQFKIHAIERAWEQDNIVLFADASIYLRPDIDKQAGINRIKSIIETEGYFMEEAGHYVKDWCNDYTLNYFKITRETDATMFSAGLIGLNRLSGVAQTFFSQWKAAAFWGCFKGDWSNHRHDMTCASIIASNEGMKYQKGGSHLAYIGKGYTKPAEDVVFYCQGM